MNNQTKEFWNNMYEKGRDYTKLHKDILADLLEEVENITGHYPENALDIGCGRGNLLINLTNLGLDAVGIDYSERALNSAETISEGEGVKEEITLKEADIEEIDPQEVPGQPFDTVWLKLVYPFLKDPDTALSKIKDLLSENGVLIIITPLLYKDRDYSKRLRNIGIQKEDLINQLKEHFPDIDIHMEGLQLTGSSMSIIIAK